MRNILGPANRQMVALVARRDGFKQKEAAKREELMDTLRQRQLDSLQQYLARARAMQARLHDQIEEADSKRRDLDRNIQQYRQMDEDVKRLDAQV